MPKIFIALFFLFWFCEAGAQQKAIDKAADSTCRCLTAMKDSIKTEADFEKAGENCTIKGMLPYLEEIAKEENISLEDIDDEEEVGEQLGEKIGMKLVVNCPFFIELITQLDIFDEEKTVTGEISGSVTDVETNDHVYLHIKDQSGKITKLIWLEYFPGSDEFKSHPGQLKGKNVTIKWKQIELYLVRHKDFIVSKVITKLSVN